MRACVCLCMGVCVCMCVEEQGPLSRPRLLWVDNRGSASESGDLATAFLYF